MSDPPPPDPPPPDPLSPQPFPTFSPPAVPPDSPPAVPPVPAAAAARTLPPRPVRVRFADLAGAAVEVEVEHDGQIYRLRRTRSGKLLLTK